MTQAEKLQKKIESINKTGETITESHYNDGFDDGANLLAPMMLELVDALKLMDCEKVSANINRFDDNEMLHDQKCIKCAALNKFEKWLEE